MAGSHFVLIASDPRLLGSVQGQVQRALGELPIACTFEEARTRLGPDTRVTALIASSTAGDVLQCVRLVQEIALRQWPVTVLSIESLAASSCPELVNVEPYVAARLQWPTDAQTLHHLLEDRLSRTAVITPERDESVADVIRRRVLNFTPSLLPLVERMALAATHDVTVLWTGETGTGKTHLAQLMHECSPRRSDRFLAVPCGALSNNLIESEFFGHARGAFTGADRPKIGKFAAAGNGTLLLDEIDALGLEQQANLLRVIETGEYEPVGSTETHHCTARIMVASNWDLEDAVKRNRFRQDLYYRLNVMAFYLPPLRERVPDIQPLVRGMVARFTSKFRKELFSIHPDTMTILEAYPWPGNIRQMENAIQQAVLLSSGHELRAEHLPQALQEFAGIRPLNGHKHRDSLAHSRETLERNVIQQALVNCGYSRARAASALGISRVTLYKKMKKYDLMAVPLSPHQLD